MARYCKWLEIANKFQIRWNLPNGIGAIDGKHIAIEQPFMVGSHYRNYKGTDSIVLLGMIGPEYEFLYADFFSLNNKNIQWTTRKVLTTDKDPFMGSICGDCEHLSQQITKHTYKIQNIKDYQEISI